MIEILEQFSEIFTFFQFLAIVGIIVFIIVIFLNSEHLFKTRIIYYFFCIMGIVALLLFSINMRKSVDTLKNRYEEASSPVGAEQETTEESTIF